MKWSDEEKDFLIRRVTKDKIHPYDVWIEMKKRFKRVKRSYASIRCWLNDNHVEFTHLIKKEQEFKPNELKEVIREDAKKIKLQQQFNVVKQKYKILSEEGSVTDRIIAVLKDEMKALPKVDLEWKPLSQKVTKETACLLLGDLHIGEKVDKEEVFNLGEYNFDVFVKRLKFLAESIKKITVQKLSGYSINKLCIFGMGDMVTGRIHEELIENAEDVIFQVMNGAYVTAQFILELAQIFPEVEVDGVLGNHGRLKKKPYFKKRYANWDFIFYQFLAMFLTANPRITCTFPKTFFLIKKIYDWSFLVMHGDSIRSWMSIPWYGIERAMWKLGDLLQGKGIKIHYRVIGHFHNTGELDKVPGEMIINGSVIGGTEYSLMNMFAFDRPTQLFFGVHKNIGMTWRFPMRLDLPGVYDVTPYAYNSELDAAKYMKQLMNLEHEIK